MTSSDPPVLTEADRATTPVEALGAAITKVLPELRRTIEVYVARSRLTRNHTEVLDLADEVLNDAVEQAIKLVDRWEPERGTRPWLAKMASFNIMQRRQKAGLERTRFPRVAPGRDAEADPAAQLIDPQSLALDRLFELLDLVPEPDRTLLRLAYVEREPQADIARRLGITDGALRVRLSRAKGRFIQEYHAAEQGGRS